MNRLACGIVFFLALAGISLLGDGADQALAGHGCCGCHGGNYGCHGGGYVGNCCGSYGGGGYDGGGVPNDDGSPNMNDPNNPVAPNGNLQNQTPPAPPPAPSANRNFQRQPFGFRRIAFRR